MNSRVAIVGLSFRFPGTSHEKFWPDLMTGKDLVTEVDPARWSHDAYFNPRKSEPGCSYTFSAGSLGDVSGFDAGFFGISPREAAQMDPQQRLLLEMTWEALEDAGIKPSAIRGSQCGVYIGIASADYAYRFADDLAAVNSSVATGNTASIAANRISYVFDLHGPSMALDTACSSSLVAFHQACRSIASGECTQAITGGVSLHLHPYGFLTFSKATMLSPRGICNVFDASGDGYVRSEGGGIFFLKDYERALADGDRILAVVAASAVNTDGKKSGLTVPSSQAQADLLCRTYQQAGIDPRAIDYVEAHGTGTAVGDPIETKALGEALGQHRAKGDPLLVGSVKSNLGHLEAASGVAGLVKALYSLKHRRVPATIHLNTPNPNIDFDGLNLKVVTESTPLKPSGKLVIGVNSFGFGGANAHVILESPDDESNEADDRLGTEKDERVPLLLSGKSAPALKAAASQYADFLRGQPVGALYDIAYSAAFHREWHEDNRAVVFGSTPQSLAQALEAFVSNEESILPVETGAALPQPSAPVFIYSGNGSQWEGMGRTLLAEEPEFRCAVREVDRLFGQFADFSIEDELAEKNGSGRYELTEVAQPALFALQVGITRVLRKRGVIPAAVAGHSVGEVAAAWASGALTLEQAVKVIYYRSKWQGTTKGQGQMNAVAMGDEAARSLLDALDLPLSVAGVNSSRGVTIAGEPAQLALLETALAERRVFYKRLDLDYAFHSPAMDPIEVGVQESLSGLLPRETDIPFYSTVTGDALAGTELGAAYWWHNIRQPVLFESAIKAMQSGAFNVFVEVGPHAVLRGYVKDCLKDGNCEGWAIPTLTRGNDSPERLSSACAQVLISGARADWTSLFPRQGRRVDLPVYPWRRERHWHATSTESYRLLQRSKEHPYLGYRLHENEWMWENQIDTLLYPTLADHVVGDAVVFPGTGYAEMALAAASLWQPASCLEIEELEIRSPLVLGETHSKTVRFHLEPGDGSFTISSRDRLSSEPWMENAVGRIVREAQSLMFERTCQSLPESPATFDTAAHHALTTAVGLGYGPAFRAIEQGWVDGQKVVATFVIPDAIVPELDKVLLHPALLDCAFQLLIDILHRDSATKTGTVFVPTKMGRLIFNTGKSRPKSAQATLVRRGPHSLVADFTLFDEAGCPLAWVKEARFRGVRLHKGGASNIRLIGEHCIPKPNPCAPDTGTPLPLELLKDGLRSALQTVAVQKSLRQYAEEIEPLLDALCSGFAAEALRKLAGGTETLTSDFVRSQTESLPATAPFLMRLLGMLVEDGVIRATGAGWEFAAESDVPAPQDIWNSLVADYPDHFPIFHAVGRVGLHLEDILSGKQPAETVLPRECSLGTLSHQTMGVANIQSVGSSIRAIVHYLLKQLPADRRFRIVELSEGKSSYAAQILPSIDFDRCDYVLATPAATTVEEYRTLQERFPGVQTRLVDFSADPAGEFVPAGERAQLVIVTSDFLAESSVLQALSYAKLNLAAGGTLIFSEQNPSRWMDFVFGGQPAWWSTVPSGTWDSRHRTAAKWQPELAQLGFQAFTPLELFPEAVSGPYLMLAQAAGTESKLASTEPAAPRTWVMLADRDGYSSLLADRLSGLLEADGGRVVRVSPGAEFDGLCPDCCQLDSRNPLQLQSLLNATRDSFGKIDGIVHLQGLGTLADAEQGGDVVLEHALGRCATAAALVQACEAAGLDASCWLLTAGSLRSLLPGRGIRNGCPAPMEDGADAPLLGFARSLMNEAGSFAVRLIDIAEPDSTGIEPVAISLARELLYPDAEQEVALNASGKRFASRLRLEPARIEAPMLGQPLASEIVSLGFQFPGQLRNLRWEARPGVAPADDEVEIEVLATGLNFRDVMYALGLLSDEAVENGFAGPTLGLELSGVILRVGEKVTGLAPGDKVVAFGPACFSNRVITKGSATALKPPGVSFEAASTIPSTFFTAYYALHHLCRLQAGEKVLIHGAAGGVGIAAIQLAKWCGAEIFATAGSEEKRDFLRLLGVDHVLDSRSLAFADQILDITAGQGVDVVLNSLAGEAINRNFSVLKPFGRFIELGKRDFYENTKIGLRPFRNNISYFGVDADQLMRDRPDLTKRLFEEVMALFRDGALHPLPYHVFDAAEIVDAFRYMQQSRQIGKIVVTYRNGITAHRDAPQTPHKLALPAQATYLVTGGLSGFGLKTAEWLADKGARHLVLVSRSGPGSPEAVEAIGRLAERGVNVRAVPCDVTDEAQLGALLADVAASMPPLRGVVHAAMVIEDGLVRNMTQEQMRRVFSPKILGARHLHRLTGQLDLDFFVLFSSATTLFGNPGQGNYVAANSYLEALAEARRAAGLPATCVRWGALDDVGFLARNEQIKAALQSRMGGEALHSSAALNALESLLVDNRSGLGVLELDWKALSRFLPSASAPRFCELSQGGDTDSASDDAEDIQHLLAELSREELLVAFSGMLKEEVAEILRMAPDKIDENQSMFNMGLDSLMGVELALAVEARFGVKLPVMALKESPTIAKLAEKLCVQLTGGGADDESAADAAKIAQLEQTASQHGVEESPEVLRQIAQRGQSDDSAPDSRMIH